MAHPLPIDVRALGKEGVLDEERFFRLLSGHCNYVAPEVVKNFYEGLFHHMTDELRKNGVVRLPRIGDFALVKQKPTMGWAGQFQRIIKGSYILTFYPHQGWRKYFKKLQENPGREGKLDPREKVLNRVL